MFQGRSQSNPHSYRVRVILFSALFLTTSMKLACVRGFQLASHHSRPSRVSTTSSLFSSSNIDMSSSTTSTAIDGPPLPLQSPTAKRLFLVRHGEVINPGGDRPVYYGAADVPLSPLGQQEAVAAGAYLRAFALNSVFSSPLSRAIYGANAVLEQQQVKEEQDDKDDAIVGQQAQELIILEGFRELDRGAWYGMTKDEIGADLMNRFDACDESVTPANGESYPFLKRRVLQALDQALVIMQPGQAACVVSHLQVTRSILSQALGVAVEEMAALKVATASVTCIDYEEVEQSADASGSPEYAATVHFQSFKPNVGLEKSKDAVN
jgi:broad specificity phosphatase PhoE